MSGKPPPESKPTERTMKDGAWFWANKSALNKIRSRCEDAKSALAVYLALCEIASDEQSESFMVSMDRISAKCGLSRPTVFFRLNDLEYIGLVEIQRSRTNQNYRIPNAYTLLKAETTALP
jgi:biotin operon repressor